MSLARSATTAAWSRLPDQPRAISWPASRLGFSKKVRIVINRHPPKRRGSIFLAVAEDRAEHIRRLLAYNLDAALLKLTNKLHWSHRTPVDGDDVGYRRQDLPGVVLGFAIFRGFVRLWRGCGYGSGAFGFDGRYAPDAYCWTKALGQRKPAVDIGQFLLKTFQASDQAPSQTASPLATLNEGAGDIAYVPLTVLTNTSAQIRGRASLATVDTYRVATLGWEWARR